MVPPNARRSRTIRITQIGILIRMNSSTRHSSRSTRPLPDGRPMIVSAAGSKNT